MGCAGSKVEELEAVRLCRGRNEFLAEAIRQRYALADAHAAYAESLRSVGASIHRLIDISGSAAFAVAPPSPHLHLPVQRKGDPLPPMSPSPTPPAIVQRETEPPHSGSGSHIEFQSSDSSDDDDSPLHSDDDTSIYHDHDHDREPVVHVRYARNQPPPNSVSYEQRPASPESVHFASSSSPSPYPPYPNYSYPFSYSDPFGYPPPPPQQSGYGYYGSYPPNSNFPPNLPPQNSWAGAGAGAGAGASSSSSSAQQPTPAPPPPPPPPRTSTWDFMNLFEGNDSYYPPYTSSRSSNEVREMEGIPDLEDEEHEVVKEAYGDRKFPPSSASASTSAVGSPEYYSKKGKGAAAGDSSSANPNPHYQSKSVGPPPEDEADVVEKNVVGDQVQRPQGEARNVAAAAANPPRRQFHNVSEIGSEMKAQSERAAASAMEISGVLEVGKHPYHHHRSAVYIVPTMMMCMTPPSNATGEEFLSFEEDMERSSRNLSSTLQKLYIWEKKLQDEVRAEEKMRLLHERNCKKLKHLDEKGAEAHKLDDVQKFIRNLSTKIRIAIQVVNTISTKINNLRDEELWPRTKELIQGLVRMWKAMLECHRVQCEAVSEAKSLDSIASGGRLGETCLEAMMQLELELLKWIGNFSAWVNAQKNYVKAINGWLVLCLHYEPEVTADGVPPYSPGRIGAPPVFVICNYWSQALDRISEKEVIDAMQAFATNLRRLWEQQSGSQHQMMAPNRDMDRWVKDRERKAQIMHKEVDALNKKLVLASGQNDLPSSATEVSSLHLGLTLIFEAMENFTANSLKAYEELHMHSEEGGVSGDNTKGS